MEKNDSTVWCETFLCLLTLALAIIHCKINSSRNLIIVVTDVDNSF